MITVLVVDDHEIVRAGISRLLSDLPGIKVIGSAASGEEAVKTVKLKHPQVVLMDVRMPGIGGLEATKKILCACPETKVIVVTVCDGEPFPTKFLQAGASGYVTKDSDIKEIVHAIKVVVTGKKYLGPEVAQQLALKNLKETSLLDNLSERELQVLMLIASGSKAQEVAQKLCISGKTVNGYRYRLFEKLGVSTDVELAHIAIRYGIVEMEAELPE